MNIIFISNSMAKAKTLSVFQVSAIVLALLVLPVLLTLLLIVPQDAPAQQGVKSSKLRFSFNIGDPQKHLDAYAVQMGELQARIMRLDAQSERLAKLAGEKKAAAPLTKSNAPSLNAPSPNAPVNKSSAANRGGPLVLSSPYTEMDLQKHIAELTARVEFETEYLSELEATLLQQSMLKGVLPNRSPIRAAFNSSSYGWRIDPFNGNKAFHEGLDFSANARLW
jgi:murein DD-endopeptidase MepM/ murein hydrolase activator NlpD